jgi:hypothetical protein
MCPFCQGPCQQYVPPKSEADAIVHRLLVSFGIEHEPCEEWRLAHAIITAMNGGPETVRSHA